jgi:hypothetical protein
MHERRERKKRTCIGEERAINKIGLIISNILEKFSRLIIPNKREYSLSKNNFAPLNMVQLSTKLCFF